MAEEGDVYYLDIGSATPHYFVVAAMISDSVGVVVNFTDARNKPSRWELIWRGDTAIGMTFRLAKDSVLLFEKALLADFDQPPFVDAPLKDRCGFGSLDRIRCQMIECQDDLHPSVLRAVKPFFDRWSSYCQ
jgi:hypothetical protein